MPLLKSKYFLINYFAKDDKLNLEARDLRKGFGGRLLVVHWRNEFTKFDINDYIKLSKKQRSHELDKKEKEVLNYNYTGICISHKKNFESTATTFVIRNVFDSFLWK